MKTSFVISALSTVVNVTLSIPFAYALARLNFPGKRWMHNLLLILIFMPMMFFFLPVRNMFVHYGMENTVFATAIPLAAQLFPALTLARFYGSIPPEMDDYAQLQGLSPLQAFLKLYLPISGRPIFYAATLSFISVWNCSFLPMFMYHDPDSLVVAQQALLHFAVHPDSIQIGMAAVILTCLPAWLLFFSEFRYAKSIQIRVIDPYKQ